MTVVVAMSRNCAVNYDRALVYFINNMFIRFVVISETGFIVLKVCFCNLKISVDC